MHKNQLGKIMLELNMEPNDLKNFLEEHFVYEVDMLYISLKHLVQFLNQNDNEKKHLALECFFTAL